MNVLSYKEFKKVYKKLTKKERADCESRYGYMSKILEDDLIELVEKTKKETLEIKKKILKK